MSSYDTLSSNPTDLAFNPPPPKYAPPAATDLPTLVSPLIPPSAITTPSTPAQLTPTNPHPIYANNINHQHSHHHHHSHLHPTISATSPASQSHPLTPTPPPSHQPTPLLSQSSLHHPSQLLLQQQQQLQQYQQQHHHQHELLKQQQHELLKHPSSSHLPLHPASSHPSPHPTPNNPPQTLEAQPSNESKTINPIFTARKTCSRYALCDFDLIRTLGTGSFGRVHLSKSRHNGRGYAIKVLNKKRVVSLKQVEHTNSERQMLAAVRHPFLVNLWGTFADSYNLYMVMDFVSGGELFNLLRKSQRFPDPVAKFFGAEVALALDYLHCLDIVYRDLKPENILLGSDGHIKITDFGFAKLVPDITWTLCGTPDYLAPEIVQSKGYNKSVDWYALGVLIFEMLAGYPPFYCEEESPMRLYEKIIAGKVRYPSYFNPSAKDLLKSLLTADLSKRFGNLANGSRDIFHHAWFAEVDWEKLYRKQIPAPYVPRVSSEWDSSNFDHYDEASLEEYGKIGEDPYGHLFPGF